MQWCPRKVRLVGREKQGPPPPPPPHHGRHQAPVKGGEALGARQPRRRLPQAAVFAAVAHRQARADSVQRVHEALRPRQAGCRGKVSLGCRRQVGWTALAVHSGAAHAGSRHRRTWPTAPETPPNTRRCQGLMSWGSDSMLCFSQSFSVSLIAVSGAIWGAAQQSREGGSEARRGCVCASERAPRRMRNSAIFGVASTPRSSRARAP